MMSTFATIDMGTGLRVWEPGLGYSVDETLL